MRGITPINNSTPQPSPEPGNQTGSAFISSGEEAAQLGLSMAHEATSVLYPKWLEANELEHQPILEVAFKAGAFSMAQLKISTAVVTSSMNMPPDEQGQS